MKKIILTLIVISLFATFQLFAQKWDKKNITKNGNVDLLIDSKAYWQRLADAGLVPYNPIIKIPNAIYKTSKINAKSVKTEDSPDVPVDEPGTSFQSENSIFVSPIDNSYVMNSNNSTTVGLDIYGANFFYSDNMGAEWNGTEQGVGGDNSGDPATAIGLDGRMYVGFIHNNRGQGVSYSEDNGITWTSVVAGDPPPVGSNNLLDKNHLWIDNSPTSPYVGNVYDAWTPFGNDNNRNIELVYSNNGGISYSTPINISSGVNTGGLNQGVNLQTGPNGEVYAVWSIYDLSNADESAIGMAKSIDGGQSFAPAYRIIDNIRGIRKTGVLKNMRVNSFPVMAVDISEGVFNGNIYVVWSNIGTPNVNTGTNVSIYMIKSEDGGTNWSLPIRVNQGVFQEGKESYQPWITCDPVTGTLSVVFYDDRNVSSQQVETWVANSYDAGETWEDFRISDVAFTPSGIPNMAANYMGDYLGISARGGKVYPVWTDNREGTFMSYVSPFETNSRARPTNLQIVLLHETGSVELNWDFDNAKSFQYFSIYRDDVYLGTSTDTYFSDLLPIYGKYEYKIYAVFEDGESFPAKNNITYGNYEISATNELHESLLINQSSVRTISVTNNGTIPVTYNVISEIISAKNITNYCTASGGGEYEYISGIQFGDINNIGTGSNNYTFYSTLSTNVTAGNTYPIGISVGEIDSNDDIGVWIDINHDGDFDDANENVICEVGIGNAGTYNYNLTIPESAVGGETVMRVRLKCNDIDCGNPCGETPYGEVEDYIININSWLETNSITETLYPGENSQILVHFFSQDLTSGNYSANINLLSYETDENLYTIPITLTVNNSIELQSLPTAENSLLCSGNETSLYANARGGSGTYTYSWSSSPAGFTSSNANPIVSPSENMIYHVTVSDGLASVTEDVSLVMASTPEQPAQPIGLGFLCKNSSNVLYQITEVSDAQYYQWSVFPTEAGSFTGENIFGNFCQHPDYIGTAYINVTPYNSCGVGVESEAFEININESLNVTISLYNDIEIDDGSIELTGGLPLGGIYSGNGVNNGYFDPEIAGLGNHVITYTYSAGNSCNDFAQTSINVVEDSKVSDVSNETVIIYPNPTTGSFYVKIDSKERGLKLNIINSLGVLVLQKDIKLNKSRKTNVDLSSFAKGIYFINIIGPKSNVIKKIIIQ